MKLIGENLHIISPATREAILNRDEAFIKALIEKQANSGVAWIDLNIGPAKKNFEGTMKWLTTLAQAVSDVGLSLDTSNIDEIKAGLENLKNPSCALLNSTGADAEKLDVMTDLAAKYGSNLICLTLNKEIGIPKQADERLALAFDIAQTAGSKGIENENLFFDPLVLPVGVEQAQALEALNSINMFKESFDPAVNTTIGLSNISNGCPKALRGLINRVFMVLAAGAGLDSAIVDAFDKELLRINSVISSQEAQKPSDKLVLKLFGMMQNYGELEDIDYDKDDREQAEIYKTAEILLNKKVYTHSYLNI